MSRFSRAVLLACCVLFTAAFIFNVVDSHLWRNKNLLHIDFTTESLFGYSSRDIESSLDLIRRSLRAIEEKMPE